MDIHELGNAGGGQTEASDSAGLEHSHPEGFHAEKQQCCTLSKQVLWNVKELPRLKSDNNKR